MVGYRSSVSWRLGPGRDVEVGADSPTLRTVVDTGRAIVQLPGDEPVAYADDVRYGDHLKTGSERHSLCT